jgi:hypothetical protein
MQTYVGERKNRRHRPGRAFERTDYRFELVTDYGAFRDLQRHRMLTIEWQPLTSTSATTCPRSCARRAGRALRGVAARSATSSTTCADQFPEQCQYVVALAYRIRYSIQMNAREAMHLIELRSGPQGHPSYRRVAHEMARLIRDEAGHRAIAGAMATSTSPTPTSNGWRPSAPRSETGISQKNG